MKLLAILLSLRSQKKAFTAADVRRTADAISSMKRAVKIADQAAAYGFEVGVLTALNGKFDKSYLRWEYLTTSPDNPFLDSNWRELVQPGEA